MFYIEKDNKILLCDENKQNLENTKMFMPQLTDLQILQTDKHIIDRHGELIFAEDIEQEIIEELRGASPRECARLLKKLFKLKQKKG